MAGEPLLLNKGEYTTINAPIGASVHNSSGKTVQIKDQGASLQLLGKSYGSSQISFGGTKLDVLVTTGSQKTFAQDALAYFRDRPGLIFHAQHPCHLVSGELLRWSDWVALSAMTNSNNGCYTFEAHIAPEITSQVMTQLKRELTKDGLHTPSISLQGKVLVRYSIEMEKSRGQISSLLNPWGLKAEFSEHTISLRPLIRVQIVVAEVSRQMARQLGLSWPGSYAAHLTPQFRLADDWQVTLSALEQSGVGKVLASPSLLTRSGDSAEFLAGGEIPLRVTRYKSRQVSWHKYGVSLKVLPRADHRGYLDVDLSVEVSSPDPGLSSDGLPAFKSHSIKTHFNLKQKSTISLGGLIRNEQGESSSGWPGLSRIPILGYLFSSKEFLENRSEMMIFVTPEIVTSTEDKSLIERPPGHGD